jgi:hypothetical protein
MKTLTLEHLSAYLPYHSMVQWTRPDDKAVLFSPLTVADYYFYIHRNKGKIILYPLSSLTETIWFEGKEICPIVELLSISNNKKINITQILCETKKYDDKEFCTIEYVENGGEPSIKSFSYDAELSRFIHRNETEGRPYATAYQLQLFKKLFEWKIDIFGLIEKGLAVDVNTLETNPYK